MNILASVSMAIVAIAFAGDVSAQSAVTWSDIDCSQSKLVAPTGLRCRSTQVIDGSSAARFSNGGAKGQFRQWATFGNSHGVKLYYLGEEAIGAVSYKAVYMSLEDEIRQSSPYAKDGKQFTPAAKLGGGDYVRFTNGQGDACVAIRKVGPVQFKGYQWVLLANECVPAGKQISDQEINQLIAAADFHA